MTTSALRSGRVQPTTALGLLVLVAVVVRASPIAESSLEDVAGLWAALALFVTVLVVRGARRGVWETSSLYLITLLVFHFGLLAVVAIGFVPSVLTPRDLGGWWSRPSGGHAAEVAFLGVVAISVGVNLMRLKSQRWSAVNKIPSDPELRELVARMATFLTVSAVAAWAVLSISAAGSRFFTLPYQEYLRKTQDLPLPYVYMLMTTGVALLGVGPSMRQARPGNVAFAFFALGAFPLGLRGEVLFPLLAFGAVYAKLRIPMRARYVVVAALVVLSLAAVVKSFRQEGYRSEVRQLTASPLEGVAELGYTFRVVAEIVGWSVELGEPHLRGTSYWAPIDRQIVSRVAGTPRVEATQDDRLVNVTVQRRLGPIGGSPIAEAYLNFGEAGVLLIMLGYGLLMGWLDRLGPSVLSQVATGLLSAPLFATIRNAFTPVPVQLAAALMLLLFLRVWPTKKVRGRQEFSPA